MPQGSVLGPLLFTLYFALILMIASIVRRHGLIVQLYADGAQLCIVFDRDYAAETIKRSEACVMEIKAWMAMNWLKFNDEKTCCCYGHLQWDLNIIIIGDNSIPPSPSARNFGAIFYEHLTMESHINNVCSASFLHLHHISSIRIVLDMKTAVIIVQAL